jgi:hypothetical protein
MGLAPHRAHAPSAIRRLPVSSPRAARTLARAHPMLIPPARPLLSPRCVLPPSAPAACCRAGARRCARRWR